LGGSTGISVICRPIGRGAPTSGSTGRKGVAATSGGSGTPPGGVGFNGGVGGVTAGVPPAGVPVRFVNGPDAGKLPAGGGGTSVCGVGSEAAGVPVLVANGSGTEKPPAGGDSGGEADGGGGGEMSVGGNCGVEMLVANRSGRDSGPAVAPGGGASSRRLGEEMSPRMKPSPWWLLSGAGPGGGADSGCISRDGRETFVRPGSSGPTERMTKVCSMDEGPVRGADPPAPPPAKACPQLLQKRAFGRFSVPHFGQNMTSYPYHPKPYAWHAPGVLCLQVAVQGKLPIAASLPRSQPTGSIVTFSKSSRQESRYAGVIPYSPPE